MKIILLFFSTFLLLLHANAQYKTDVISSSCPDGNSVVIMDYKSHQLTYMNIKSEAGDKFTIPDLTPETYSNIAVLNDSLVLLSGKYIYNYKTGKQNTAFTNSTFTTPSGKRIFQLVNNELKEINIDGITLGNSTKLSLPILSPIHNLMKINEAASFAAIAFSNGKRGQSIGIFNLKEGKLVRLFDDFKEGNDSKEIQFMDISPNGEMLVVGNTKTVKLYNINAGKTIREFEEISKNNRINFTQANFRADGKAVYIASWFKIYTLNVTKFEADENIVVSNNIKTTRWNDKYGLTHKEKIVITTDYYWNSHCLMADGKYIVGIAKHKKEDDYIIYYMFLGEGGIGNKNMSL